MRGMGRKLQILLLTAAVLALGNGTALATEWTLTDLSLQGDIAGMSYAAKINNNGDIVGSALFAGDGYNHAALWSGGSAYNLGTLGSASMAQSINDAGVIVGDSYYPMGSELGTGRHAAIFSTSAAPVDILPTSTYPTYDSSVAADINNSGDIGGYALYSFGQTDPLMWSDPATFQVLDGGGTAGYIRDINNMGQASGDVGVWRKLITGYEAYHSEAAYWDADGTLTNLGLFGGDVSNSLDINDLGQVLVVVMDGSREWSLVWQDGESVQTLAGLGGDSTTANAINNSGLIVGMAKTTDGAKHAVLWQDGEIIDLNGLISGTDLVLEYAIDINEQGQIVGIARMPDGSTLGRQVAFLLSPNLTPTPVPASLLLFGSGLAGLGLFRRRMLA
jgi:probable HAF family extracellular repeat protein